MGMYGFKRAHNRSRAPVFRCQQAIECRICRLKRCRNAMFEPKVPAIHAWGIFLHGARRVGSIVGVRHQSLCVFSAAFRQVYIVFQGMCDHQMRIVNTGHCMPRAYSIITIRRL